MSRLEQYQLALPVLASILLILTLPPFSIPHIVWFALIPLYFFVQFAQTKADFLFGAIFFSIFFSGYITYSILSGLTWIIEAQLFDWFMNGLGFVIVSLATLMSVICFQVLRVIKPFRYFFLLSAPLSFVALEQLLSTLYFNFNYGALGYTIISNPLLLTLGSSYGVWIITVIIVWINFSIGDFLWYSYRKKSIIPSVIFFMTGAIIVGTLWQLTNHSDTTVQATEEITIAIIQDNDRDTETAFGRVVDGKFSFPALEAWLETARNESVDVIIYPFNPWSGVLGDIDTNFQFDRPLIAVDTTQFADWTSKHVAQDTIFITWYSTYNGTDFFNEIVYWQHGEIIHRYQKQELFPFFDYTPQWAANIGMYSTPVDVTAGESATAFEFGDTLIGNVICSELADTTIMESTAISSDVILAIGSEAMFASSIPSEFNYLNAKYFAARHSTPVVRATKLGPSGVFASNGSTIASLPYNETGLIIATIPIAAK